MSNLSTYASDKVLDHLFGGSAYTQPTPYLALFTTTPTMPAGTGGTEVSTSGTAYARILLTSSNMAAASSESKANSAIIAFVTATASWGTVVGAGVYDAITSGNLLTAGALGTSQAIANGNTFQIAIGALIEALA